MFDHGASGEGCTLFKPGRVNEQGSTIMLVKCVASSIT